MHSCGDSLAPALQGQSRSWIHGVCAQLCCKNMCLQELSWYRGQQCPRLRHSQTIQRRVIQNRESLAKWLSFALQKPRHFRCARFLSPGGDLCKHLQLAYVPRAATSTAKHITWREEMLPHAHMLRPREASPHIVALRSQTCANAQTPVPEASCALRHTLLSFFKTIHVAAALHAGQRGAALLASIWMHMLPSLVAEVWDIEPDLPLIPTQRRTD